MARSVVKIACQQIGAKRAEPLDSAGNDYSNKTVGNPVETARCPAGPDDRPIDLDQPGLFG